MAGEEPLSPSQVRTDGRWRPIRHKTAPSLRSPSSPSIPGRRSSLRAVWRHKPLSTIKEDKAPSVKSDSTVSLRLNTNLPQQPSARSPSSEHLVYFHPSQQLQNFQSVSFHCTDGAYESMPRMYRTQSQSTAPSLRSYELHDSSAENSPTVYRTAASFELGEQPEAGVNRTAVEEDNPREAIAELFHRVEEYEREHPDVVRDSGKVWVRVNSIGHGMTKTFKTMSLLRKKKTFEARLGHNVPVQSRLRVYEKPSEMKRINIAMHDCWRKFRNWSTGRDTELGVNKNSLQHPDRIMNASTASLTLPERSTGRLQLGPRKLLRATRLDDTAHSAGFAREVRRDSKMSTGEQIKRRKSSLFLDVYSSDISNDSGSSRR